VSLGLVAVVPLGLAADEGAVPADADTSAEQSSQNGLYRVAYESRVSPVPINRLHAWIITVQTAAGAGVDNAKMAVSGDMLEHGHGMPTKPRITQTLGQGQYLLEGMQFMMPGFWVVDLEIEAEPGRDTVRFQLFPGPG